MKNNREPEVIHQQTQHVKWLTLNRPHQRNPLSSNMMLCLRELIEQSTKDEKTRVIVIKANGPVFCAGHSLKEMSHRKDESRNERSTRIRKILSECSALMLSIMNNPKPIIASVQGPATAAGCQLVSACDMAIGTYESSFCTPGVNVGVFCTTPLVGVGRTIHRKHAMEMALTGDSITAEKAERYGLINKAVDPKELETETIALAEKIASRSAQTISAGKAMFYRQIEVPIADAFSLANETMLNNITSEEGDAQEGISAFLEKRNPAWKGL